MNEMIEAFDLADADDAVRAVIVTGAGRGFSSGADLKAGFDPHPDEVIRPGSHPPLLTTAGQISAEWAIWLSRPHVEIGRRGEVGPATA